MGTVARTAVVAGTATVVGGSIARRRRHRAQAEEAAMWGQSQMSDVQNQIRALQAQQAQAAVGTPSTTIQSQPTIAQQIQQLQSLNAAGVLSDREFEAAKAKLLGT
jgi:ABC-type sugar transport system substrate-binding protein